MLTEVYCDAGISPAYMPTPNTSTLAPKLVGRIVVLDSLQRKADAQGKLDGMGLITSDKVVHRIEAVKRVVDRPGQVGTKITISQLM